MNRKWHFVALLVHAWFAHWFTLVHFGSLWFKAWLTLVLVWFKAWFTHWFTLVHVWLTLGPRLIHFGSHVVHVWFTLGSRIGPLLVHALVHVWFTLGSHLVHAWFTFGLPRCWFTFGLLWFTTTKRGPSVNQT